MVPRIRIRTSEGERVVGSSNCSVLTVALVAQAQRHTLQLRADARLLAGERVLEHVTWSWPELSDATTVELISEPSASPYAAYDPPDALHAAKIDPPQDPEQQRAAELAYRAAERELQEAVRQLEAFSGTSASEAVPASGHAKLHSPSAHCSFCGKGQAEVRKLLAGPAVFICDACVQAANELLAD